MRWSIPSCARAVSVVHSAAMAATNRDLQDEQSGFRQDLFFRLNVVAIEPVTAADAST